MPPGFRLASAMVSWSCCRFGIRCAAIRASKKS